MKREQSEQHANEPDHARKDHARIVEFTIKSKQSDGEQDRGNIWIEQPREQLLAQGQRVKAHWLTSHVDHDFGIIETRDGLAIELLEEFILILCDVLNQVIGEGFIGAE